MLTWSFLSYYRRCVLGTVVICLVVQQLFIAYDGQSSPKHYSVKWAVTQSNLSSSAHHHKGVWRHTYITQLHNVIMHINLRSSHSSPSHFVFFYSFLFSFSSVIIPLFLSLPPACDSILFLSTFASLSLFPVFLFYLRFSSHHFINFCLFSMSHDISLFPFTERVIK
jgi:hypothetical protein